MNRNSGFGRNAAGAGGGGYSHLSGSTSGSSASRYGSALPPINRGGATAPPSGNNNSGSRGGAGGAVGEGNVGPDGLYHYRHFPDPDRFEYNRFNDTANPNYGRRPGYLGGGGGQQRDNDPPQSTYGGGESRRTTYGGTGRDNENHNGAGGGGGYGSQNPDYNRNNQSGAAGFGRSDNTIRGGAQGRLSATPASRYESDRYQMPARPNYLGGGGSSRGSRGNSDGFSNYPPSIGSSDNDYPIIPGARQERTYSCQLCHETATNEADIEDHLWRSHRIRAAEARQFVAIQSRTQRFD